jgi:peroxiredoxin
MAETLTRGTLLRDIPVRTVDGRDAFISEYRGKRNVVVVFFGEGERQDTGAVTPDDAALAEEEAVLLIATAKAARALYDAPKSALFIADRYGEIFFSVRHPEPLPDAAEVLKWLEFINLQCPE